jgi:putative Mn2+ efflux pump MntP
MDLENVLIIGIGVVIFLMAFDQRNPYSSGVLLWCMGIVLVYLGLKREQDKKKGKIK